MKSSLTTKITIIFVFTFSVVAILFVTFGYLQNQRVIEIMKMSQLKAVNYLFNLYKQDTLPLDTKEYFQNFNFDVVTDKNMIISILTSSEEVFSRKNEIAEFISLKYNNSLYLYIKNDSFAIMLESIGVKNINDPLWIGFFITMVLLLSLYVSVMRSLKPLKKLHKNIKKFASGNMDFEKTSISGYDEIAQVANEFDNAVMKIKELVRSRQLFLRTIMHELKTPISKGRIVSELIDDDTQKNRLVNVFERLEILINEFAKIEQLLAKSYSLNYQECHLSLILEQVKDILMLDDWDEKIELHLVDDAILRVDFQLFSLAIKNLIDNALKYSDDRHVKISCDKYQICISNRSKPLPVSIEHYKQAFIRNKDSKVSGMGLGLYIIDKICIMHKFQLKYFYSDDMHHFSVVFNQNNFDKE